MKNKYKGYLQGIVCLLIFLHIINYLLLLTSRRFQDYVYSHDLLKIYAQHTVIGPFFREDPLLHSPRVLMSVQNEYGQWSELINFPKSNFIGYHQNKLKLHLLKRARMEQKLAKLLYNSIDSNKSSPQDSKDFRKFKDYLSSQYVAKDLDSVRILYCQSVVEDFKKTRMDTLFDIRYSTK